MKSASLALVALCTSSIANADDCANAAFNSVAAENIMVCAGIYLTPEGQSDQNAWPQILAGCANADTEIAIARSQVQQIVREQVPTSRACAYIAETANVQTGREIFAGHKSR
jgi:hypothetical protein